MQVAYVGSDEALLCKRPKAREQRLPVPVQLIFTDLLHLKVVSSLGVGSKPALGQQLRSSIYSLACYKLQMVMHRQAYGQSKLCFSLGRLECVRSGILGSCSPEMLMTRC